MQMEQIQAPKRVIALGFFDGIHIGHLALIDKAKARAKELGAIPSIYTFDRHPASVISGTPVPLITSPLGRIEEVRRLSGVQDVIFGKFDDALIHTSWQDFISEILVKQYNACHIITGVNNRFGYRGEGTAERLQAECRRLGIGCDCIDNVTIDGIVVSSTYIRSLIAAGDMERAAEFLGHPYSVSGVVGHGRKVGRTIGVPTVNILLPEHIQKPPFGVYAAKVAVGRKGYLAVTNIGTRPTFDDSNLETVEPHLLDFDGDLYGKFIRVELYKYLRPEKKFQNTEELKAAIAKNVQQTREFFEETLLKG